jgi:hypothetical protein
MVARKSIRKPKPKSQPKSNYQKVGEYFRKDSRKGVRFGTMKADDGSCLVLISPVEKGTDGNIYSIQREFNGKKSPVNITLDAKRTRIFREMLDEAILAAKAR